jgi:hypothetical protein
VYGRNGMRLGLGDHDRGGSILGEGIEKYV